MKCYETSCLYCVRACVRDYSDVACWLMVMMMMLIQWYPFIMQMWAREGVSRKLVIRILVSQEPADCGLFVYEGLGI